ncbi:MAG: hypothetical protein OXG19_09725 [Chloroflexi bacterium]|nr:hypothetical protein [Chloroflexota bacterium]
MTTAALVRIEARSHLLLPDTIMAALGEFIRAVDRSVPVGSHGIGGITGPSPALKVDDGPPAAVRLLHPRGQRDGGVPLRLARRR